MAKEFFHLGVRVDNPELLKIGNDKMTKLSKDGWRLVCDNYAQGYTTMIYLFERDIPSHPYRDPNLA